MPRPLGHLALATALAAALPAQVATPLPHATGHLTVPATWSVLTAADLAAEARPTDPKGEPGLTVLLGTIAELRTGKRENDNLLLHQPGTAPGQLRIVDAYSDAAAVRSVELQSRDAVERMSRTFQEHIAVPGANVVFHGQSTPPLFGVGCVALLYRVDLPQGSVHRQLYAVPAGERLQYFETSYSAEDLDAPLAIAALLQTFDGAAEPPNDDVLRNMILGGLAGAVAGIGVAVLRRRRLQQAAGRAHAGR